MYDAYYLNMFQWKQSSIKPSNQTAQLPGKKKLEQYIPFSAKTQLQVSSWKMLSLLWVIIKFHTSLIYTECSYLNGEDTQKRIKINVAHYKYCANWKKHRKPKAKMALSCHYDKTRMAVTCEVRVDNRLVPLGGWVNLPSTAGTTNFQHDSSI